MHNIQARWCSIWLFLGVVTLLAAGTADAQQKPASLVVEAVAADLPGAKAGLKIDDRIMTYNDKEVASPAAFHAAASCNFR